MGLRFRKSIKLGGGTRLNLSKSGVGFSFGTKGARVTKKAGGGTRTTISVPGTGISYVQDSGKSKRSSGNSGRGGMAGLNSNGPKKRKTWLWVLGWIFIFPVPLTVLMLRKKDMKPAAKYGIIAAGWIVYLLIGLFGSSGSAGEGTPRNQTPISSDAETIGSSKSAGEGTSRNQTPNTSEAIGNISEINFSKMDDVTLKIGDTYSSGQVKVEVKDKNEFSPDDVKFISDDPNVAIIEYTDISKSFLSTKLSYDITAKGAGETTVFVTSADGTISSDKIKVIVPEPVEVESIRLGEVNSNLVLGEHTHVTANVFPENADNKEIRWASSDESVATVDKEGNIIAVSGGVSTISATSSNNITESFELNVDGTKRVMKLNVSQTREDDTNIGDEWSYDIQVNGEKAGGEYIISVGDTLSFYAEFTESDDNPDVGKASTTYTVTEDDLINGFTVSMDLNVTENGGRNSGKSVHFIVNYDYTAK